MEKGSKYKNITSRHCKVFAIVSSTLRNSPSLSGIREVTVLRPAEEKKTGPKKGQKRAARHLENITTTKESYDRLREKRMRNMDE